MANRSYGEACGLAHALDLVGERWALLVVRELLLGPKRFTDLRAGLAGASPNVLAQRLRELEDVGVVHRRRLALPASSAVYELTEWGRELEPIVLALGTWGLRSSLMDGSGIRSVDSMMLALRTYFAPAKGWDATYELVFGTDRLMVRVRDKQLEVARDGYGPADATLATDTDTLADLLGAGRNLTTAIASGAAEVNGDKQALRRLLDAIVIPEPAPAKSRR
jgi:DNA-binding HxlR family transcriptional regulator